MKEHPDEVIHTVAAEALSSWDLGGSALTIVSRSENVVFRVETAERGNFALRVHRPGYHTLAELESESVWTTALNEAGIGAPIAVPTRDGDHYAVIGVPETDETRHVGLIPWFDGAPMDAMIEQAPDEASRNIRFEQLGRLMASMHNQAVAWQPPAHFQRHALDADGFVGEAPFWGRFWEISELTGDQREALLEARHLIHARLSALGKDPDTYSMIHADLRSANVLVTAHRVHVIDFDDAGFGWHHYDIAVALSDYAMDPDFDAIQDALMAGYRTQRPFSNDDLGLLPLFLMIRVLAGLGWLHDRPEVELYELMPALIEIACDGVEEFLS